MKVIIASDHGGINIRKEIMSLMDELEIPYEDLGCDCETSVDYPDYALPVAQRVANGEFDRGILICGTGIGMSMAAGKMKGIRAACCSDAFSAKYTRLHNNANVLCLGARVVGEGLACELADIFVDTGFEGGKHQRRIDLISELENSR